MCSELDAGRESILELIAHLDRKKDEAIDRTFKAIGKHFSEVFAELVPGGKAILVLETKGVNTHATRNTSSSGPRAGDACMHLALFLIFFCLSLSMCVLQLDGSEHEMDMGEEEEGGEGEEEEESAESEERKESTRRPKKKARKSTAAAAKKDVIPSSAYSGIGIRVSFAGVSSHTHQLSGGQMSVVALSLIFAIQRCDPSPFYLFDEIDSALDPVHRTAVSNMVAAQSANIQFLCTTFHAELLAAADKFYGVTFKNKQSYVRTINRDDALKLIQVSEREAEQQ